MKKLTLLVVILTFIITSGCNNSDDNPAGPPTKGSITGIITDQSTGNGIEGAAISTQPATANVTTDNDGKYTITDVEAGDYTVTVTIQGYFPVTSNVTVEASQTATKNVSLSAIPPDPTASFNYGGSTVTPAAITFQNASQNATNYLWDFGDGTTSTEENPSKSYNEMGHYNVKLTASNNVTGKSAEMTKEIVITPGKVFLQKVYVDAYPPLNGNGAGWDLSSGPDIFFTMIDASENEVANGSTFNDVTPSMLPIYWQFDPEAEFLSSSWSNTYSIHLWDYDSLGDDFMGTTGSFSINEEISAGYPSTVSLQSNSGDLKVRLILRWQ